LFWHGQALAANGQAEAAGDYVRRAYDEMMRKYALIPADSHFRMTYLEKLPLHRQILSSHLGTAKTAPVPAALPDVTA
jgi:hypothetical protein